MASVKSGINSISRTEAKLIGPELLTILLYGSVAFCWLCVMLVTMSGKPPVLTINNPALQIKICIAACAVIVGLSGGLSAAYTFFPSRMPPASAEILNLIVAVAMVVLGLAGSAMAGDTPASTGLSLKNIQTISIFLVPPVSLMLFRGGYMNFKMLVGSITLASAAPAMAEEFFFRGYLQPRFQKFSGTGKGLLMAALAATIYRTVPLCFMASIHTIAIISIMYFIIWGIVAGHIFSRTGNIFGITILHIFWDTAVRVFAGISVQ